MKKIILILICMSLFLGSLFAGKPVRREISPLSVLTSEKDRESWCELDGWAVVLNENLHYWLYFSYYYHDGDISPILNEIVPKWFQSMGYFVVPDYKIVSPNNDLAYSVKKLMYDNGCDVSITFVKGNNGYDNVIVNSCDLETGCYSTYIFSGTKVDRGKIDSNTSAKNSISSKKVWYDAFELKEWRAYLDKNISKEVQEFIFNSISERIDSHKSINKYFLRYVEAKLQVNFSRSKKVPEKFDISGKMSDAKLADIINKVAF